MNQLGDITVVIPSCNRPELMEQTLACLMPHVERHRMPVLIGENCGFTDEVRACVDAIAGRHPEAAIRLFDLTRADNPRMPQRRMLRSVDRLYARVDTPFIFHCEDDWWLSEDDFITPSRAILDRFPDIKIVRLSERSIKPWPDENRRLTIHYEPSSTVTFWYSRYGGPNGDYGAFTFHPGLRRQSDYIESFETYERFGHESEISRHGQRLGHRVAILEGVHARHIGSESRMANTPGR